MTRNTSYLLRLWWPAGLIAACVAIPIAIGLPIALWQGQTEAALIVAVAILLPVALFVGIRWLQNWRVRRLFQSPVPEALISFCRRSARMALIADADALVAHNCASVYILYGQFEDARSQLRSVSWERRAPLIAACGQASEALLCYLDTREYERGLTIARAAQELGTVHKAFPGAATSHAALASFVQIGEVLTGHGTRSTIQSLEDHYRHLPLVGKLLVAWGLKQAYGQSGDVNRAQAMDHFIRQLGPNCRALLT
jgi:hypothetical protein